MPGDLLHVSKINLHCDLYAELLYIDRIRTLSMGALCLAYPGSHVISRRMAISFCILQQARLAAQSM